MTEFAGARLRFAPSSSSCSTSQTVTNTCLAVLPLPLGAETHLGTDTTQHLSHDALDVCTHVVRTPLGIMVLTLCMTSHR